MSRHHHMSCNNSNCHTNNQNSALFFGFVLLCLSQQDGYKPNKIEQKGVSNGTEKEQGKSGGS